MNSFAWPTCTLSDRRQGSLVIRLLAMLLLAAAAVLGPAWAGLISPAQAHDSVADFSPKENETLADLPDSIRLTMKENPLEVGAKIVVADAAGKDWSEGTPKISGAVVEQPIASGAPAGRYTVQWRVVSGDGHPIESTYSFTVSPVSPVSPVTQASGNPSTAPGTTPAAAPTASAAVPQAPAVQASGAETEASDGALANGLLIAGLIVAGLSLVAVLAALVRRAEARPRPWHLLVLAVVLALALVVFTFLLARGSDGSGHPAEGSADAGFARDMQQHHAQAVDMSMIIRDRSSDQAVRTMAYDIALTQQHQIGQMYAWLQEWGLPQASDEAPMAWVTATEGSDGHADGHGAGAAMVGMATNAELAALRRSSGAEADRLFLTLMIRHHEGGVEMAEAALDSETTDQVRSLARGIIVAQKSEIKAMEEMLAAGPETSGNAHSETEGH